MNKPEDQSMAPDNQPDETKKLHDHDHAVIPEEPVADAGLVKELSTKVLGQTLEKASAASKEVLGAAGEGLTTAMDTIAKAKDHLIAAGKNAGEGAKEKIETIRSGATQFQNRVGEIGDDLREKAKTAAEGMQPTLEKIEETAKSTFSAARDATIAVEKRTEILAEKAVELTRRHESKSVTGTLADERQMRLGHVAYLLYALGPVTLVSSLFGVLFCYLRLGDETVIGTILQSHLRWLIRTFWLSAGGLVVASVAVWTFGIFAGGSVLLLVLLWFAYRVMKGWLSLYDGKQLTKPSALL